MIMDKSLPTSSLGVNYGKSSDDRLDNANNGKRLLGRPFSLNRSEGKYLHKL
jgi:hypothetical protein